MMIDDPKDTKIRNISLLVFSMMLWGLTFPLIKLSLEEIGPITLGLLRSLFGAIPLFIYVLYQKGLKKITIITKNYYLLFIAIGLTQFYLPLATQNTGMSMMEPETAASLSSILQASYPVFAIIMSVAFLKEYIGKKKALGTAIALTGTILLVTQGGVDISNSALLGNLLLLTSSVCYAISSVITKRSLVKHEPLTLMTMALVFSSLIFLPTSFALEPVSRIANISMMTWLMIIYLGLIGNGIALLLWYIVLVKTQLSKQVLFTYLIPLFGNIFSHLILGETISLISFLFGMLIVTGVAIVQYERKT
ncbi:MAG: DMT family transporter [Thermoplasmatota archaeon]